MSTRNTPFFGAFPKIEYDINNILTLSSGPHETVTDIFFRFGYMKSLLNNASSYYAYEIQDSDTPELLAENIYNDSGAGWIIIYANKIVDPLFDWPLNYDAFTKMIIDKYGSVESAQTTTHHCEKVISRYNTFADVTTETRFIIDNTRLTLNVPRVPYSYYTPYTKTTHRTADSNVFTSDNYQIPFLTADLQYDDVVTVSKVGSVAYAHEVNTYEVDGKTIVETITGSAISNFDYELKLNDDKKLIKIIKAQYYNQIMKEFADLTKTTSSYVRTLM